jgi:hypothetical protein
MAEITLKEIFGTEKGWEVYTVQKDFSWISQPEAGRIAKLVAAAMATRGPGDGEAVIRTIAFSMKQANRGIFLAGVGWAFGGTRMFKAVKKTKTFYGTNFQYEAFEPGRVGALELMDVTWSRGKDPQPAQAVVLIPTGPYKAIDGETRTYTFMTFSEEGESKGNEVSVEVYVTTEGGVSMPIPIASFSAKAGEKIATKTYKRQESKRATRASDATSKSYLIQKVRQRVMAFNANIIEDTGFVVQRKDVGDTLGPFWPVYRATGVADLDEARKETDAAVDELIEAAAGDMAYRARRH